MLVGAFAPERRSLQAKPHPVGIRRDPPPRLEEGALRWRIERGEVLALEDVHENGLAVRERHRRRRPAHRSRLGVLQSTESFPRKIFRTFNERKAIPMPKRAALEAAELSRNIGAAAPEDLRQRKAARHRDIR